MIYSIFFISLILIIWFKSDAFIEYSKLLKLSNYFKIDEWEEFKKTIDCSTSYHTFLRLKYPKFIVKLITCPICLSVWLSIPFIFVFGIINCPIIIISSLFIYYGLVKLM